MSAGLSCAGRRKRSCDRHEAHHAHRMGLGQLEPAAVEGIAVAMGEDGGLPVRKRHARNRQYPDNMRERNGYFSWVNPLDKREKGLGRDRLKAIIWSREANQAVEKIRVEVTAEQWVRGIVTPPPPPPPAFDPENLLTLDELKGLEKLSTDGGVYFLLLDGVLQYVGMSRCIFMRLEQHKKQQRIAFNESRCLLIPEKGLRQTMEEAYIARYLPPYNRSVPSRPARAEIECAVP